MLGDLHPTSIPSLLRGPILILWWGGKGTNTLQPKRVVYFTLGTWPNIVSKGLMDSSAEVTNKPVFMHER